MNKAELAKSIYDTSHLQGEFLLRSGQISNEYFDKYLFESNPLLLEHIASQLAEIIPKDIDILAGLEMGGIPIATALSLKTGIPVVFVRKEAKKYGTCKLAEGNEFKGKKLLIVEDVITTGGQVVLSTKELRELGAIIENAVCVIVRNVVGRNNLKAEGLNLTALFTMDDLKSHI